MMNFAAAFIFVFQCETRRKTCVCRCVVSYLRRILNHSVKQWFWVFSDFCSRDMTVVSLANLHLGGLLCVSDSSMAH